jgi:hypothetical protein
MTVGQLKKKLEGIPDDITVVRQDGNIYAGDVVFTLAKVRGASKIREVWNDAGNKTRLLDSVIVG